ncbi:MAG: hypothetical protein Q8O67_26380 [Deltaproteobacteria bacterium]|nr:hypothetical protein [Deltaproteobacteria bacterium]
MSVIACPRHGVLNGDTPSPDDVAKDAPCPDCGVPAYDLDDRRARDVVRQNRELAHKTRKLIGGTVTFFAVSAVAAGGAFVQSAGETSINVMSLLAGGIAAAFAARPIALKLERDPRLRQLDDELTKRKV